MGLLSFLGWHRQQINDWTLPKVTSLTSGQRDDASWILLNCSEHSAVPWLKFILNYLIKGDPSFGFLYILFIYYFYWDFLHFCHKNEKFNICWDQTKILNCKGYINGLKASFSRQSNTFHLKYITRNELDFLIYLHNFLLFKMWKIINEQL